MFTSASVCLAVHVLMRASYQHSLQESRPICCAKLHVKYCCFGFLCFTVDVTVSCRHADADNARLHLEHYCMCYGRHVQWLLVDGEKGGSGQALPWHKLKVPRHLADKGWLLAGGLHPDNVAEAVQILHPSFVDVSSGVTQADGIRKDKHKVNAFVNAAKTGSQQLH